MNFKKPRGDRDVTFLCNVRVQYTDANAGHSTGRSQLYNIRVSLCSDSDTANPILFVSSNFLIVRHPLAA